MIDSFLGLLQNKKRSRTDEHNHTGSSLLRLSVSNSTESLINNNLSINSTSDDLNYENPDDERQAPKRLALQDSNIPRYEKEFLELSLIGKCD